MKPSRVTIGEAEVRIVQWGEGPDILLLHGCPGSLQDWIPMMEGLGEDYRLTAIDRLGYGGSDEKPEMFRLEDEAFFLTELIYQLGLHNPILVGQSYGASLALRIASASPDLPRAVCAINAPVFEPYPRIQHGVGKRLMQKSLTHPQWGQTIARYMIGATLVDHQVSAAPDREEGLSDRVEENQILWTKPNVLIATAHELNHIDDGLRDLGQSLHGLSCPVLALTGECDDPFYREQAEGLISSIAHGRHETVEGTAHYAQLDDPVQVAAKLLRFTRLLAA